MHLFRISLTVPLEREEFVCQLLESRAISFETRLELTSLPGTRQPARTLICYAAPEDNERWWNLLDRHDLAPYATREPFDYDPEDWVNRWRDYYEWTEISPQLAVGPHFKPPPAGIAHLVHIRPGQAFGTGVHPSTRLALAALEPCVNDKASLLDVGCGSGILTIAAAQLGAHAVGFDCDHQSVREARDNARLNNVTCEFFSGTIDAVTTTFDVVVANLLTFRLLNLATALQERVRPGGTLILSGLARRDRESFAPRFFGHSSRVPADELFTLVSEETRADWWSCTWRKKP